MAEKKSMPIPYDDDDTDYIPYSEQVVFEVTREVVVGQVKRGDGDLNLDEAAFLLIARASRDEEGGTFRFPGGEIGTVIAVDVRMERHRVD